MLEWLRKHFLTVEWVLPTVAIAVIMLWGEPVRGYLPHAMLTGVRSTVYGTIGAIFGSVLGFVITGITILTTMGDTPKLILVQRSVMYDRIFQVFTSTTRWLALGTFVAIGGLVLDKDLSAGVSLSVATWWYSWIVAGVVVVVGLRIWRCIWVLEQVIKIILADRKPLKRKIRPAAAVPQQDPLEPLD